MHPRTQASFLFFLTSFLLPALNQAGPVTTRDDPCEPFGDRTFRILSMSSSGFGTLSQRHQAMYSAFSTNEVDVYVTGDGCDEQQLKCKSDVGAVYDPDSGIIYYTSSTKCGTTAPADASSPDDISIFENIVMTNGTCEAVCALLPTNIPNPPAPVSTTPISTVTGTSPDPIPTVTSI
ncbi:hypothetical protein GQ53DRAFT_760401 [Thozetella sp. PMI_491]|nr:hypothetical protein GQ53DRAFT_760401 [Thozetella sp. PMI_491]